jgi:hypothetical protein
VSAVSGRGTVCSWIISQSPRDRAETPRVVALIGLEEGPRLVSNLVDVDPGDVHNDMPVVVCFVDHGPVVLPQFRRMGAAPERGDS